MFLKCFPQVADMQQEHQREMEGLLDNIRQVSQELRLQMLIMDSFIPPEFQQMIEQYVHWNEDIGEWQLVRCTVPCVEYPICPVVYLQVSVLVVRPKHPNITLCHLYV